MDDRLFRITGPIEMCSHMTVFLYVCMVNELSFVLSLLVANCYAAQCAAVKRAWVNLTLFTDSG